MLLFAYKIETKFMEEIIVAIELKTRDLERVEALAQAEDMAVPALAARLLERGLG
jgi:hypothetical protein